MTEERKRGDQNMERDEKKREKIGKQNLSHKVLRRNVQTGWIGLRRSRGSGNILVGE